MTALTRDHEIEVLEGVERIAASPAFGSGDRLSSMLRWLVREELSGRGERIKGFSLATEVLGRGDGFDPQSDSIARAEMGRLRKALELHYATEGKAEPVRISFGKGSYRPVVTLAPLMDDASPAPPPDRSLADTPFRVARIAIVFALAAVAALASVLLWRAQDQALPDAPSLVIRASAPAGGSAAAQLAKGLEAEIAARLSHVDWLTVLLSPDEDAAGTPVADNRYALDIRLGYDEGRYTIHAFLKRARDNAVRWSRTYAGGYLHRETQALIAEVAEIMAGDLGRPGGAIETQEALRTAGADDAAERAFACRLAARRYWRTYDMADRAEATACMQGLLAEDAASAEARAVLALLAVDAARGATGAERAGHLDAARSLLAPVAREGLLALTATLALAACDADREGVVRTAKALSARFPNDPAVLADIGSKLGLAAGDWTGAAAAEAAALKRNPFPDPWYPLSTAVKALLDQAPAAALAALGQAPQRGFVTGRIVRLAAGGLLRDAMIVGHERAALARAGLATPEDIRNRLAAECWSPEAKAAVARGLDAAFD